MLKRPAAYLSIIYFRLLFPMGNASLFVNILRGSGYFIKSKDLTCRAPDESTKYYYGIDDDPANAAVARPAPCYAGWWTVR
jgi:hypothetical protein